MSSQKQRRSFPSIAAYNVGETASYESIAADLDRTLLISRSSFPYFMWVAIEAGSLLRCLILLLSLLLVIVSYFFFSEAVGIQILIFIFFSGLKSPSSDPYGLSNSTTEVKVLAHWIRSYMPPHC
ncbi:hypothetical protein ACFX11_023367 [Malus domestica]